MEALAHIAVMHAPSGRELIRASCKAYRESFDALEGLDNASNGDLNFGESTLDLIKKTCVGSVYDAWS